jgi:hypothetical protein
MRRDTLPPRRDSSPFTRRPAGESAADPSPCGKGGCGSRARIITWTGAQRWGSIRTGDCFGWQCSKVPHQPRSPKSWPNKARKMGLCWTGDTRRAWCSDHMPLRIRRGPNWAPGGLWRRFSVFGPSRCGEARSALVHWPPSPSGCGRSEPNVDGAPSRLPEGPFLVGRQHEVGRHDGLPGFRRGKFLGIIVFGRLRVSKRH